MTKGPSLRQTRGNAKRLVLFIVVKGCFTAVNLGDVKILGPFSLWRRISLLRRTSSLQRRGPLQ